MVTVQSPSKNGTALVKYLLEEESHRDDVDRNLYVTTVNLMPNKNHDPSKYLDQFRNEWALAKNGHEVQMRHMIFSCSQKEWLAEDEQSAALEFGELVADYLREYYPDRRAVIAVQIDGKGFFVDSNNEIIRTKKGCATRNEEHAKKISGENNVREEHILHVHAALSDCDMKYYKGVGCEKSRYSFLRDTFDEFFIEKTGLEIDKGEHRGRTRYLKGQLQEEATNEGNEFISFKDDIADRIDQCIANCSDMKMFYDSLPEFGVKIRTRKNGDMFHTNKKTGKQYVTFELVDQSRTIDGQRNADGTLKICSLRSFNFDSEGYDIDEIEKKISENEHDNKPLNIHDYYLEKMHGADSDEYQAELDNENQNYFAEMKAKAEEADRKRKEEREKELEGDGGHIETSEERWARKEAMWAYKARKKAEREAAAKAEAEKLAAEKLAESENEAISVVPEAPENHIDEVMEKAERYEREYSEKSLKETGEGFALDRRGKY